MSAVNVSWTDTQITATVGAGALSGMARVQQGGVLSNAVGFTVTVAGGNVVMPSLLNMLVGDTHTMQALSGTGQAVTGLTWKSSDPTVVSVSADDPPVLTAVAAGHVTITGGTGTSDVTVTAATLPNGDPASLPVGTVLWSNPGNGSGVNWIVPAVPSPSGVADVFAFQNDGTVQAITSDGSTAWTAVAKTIAVPDFQGGLVVETDDEAGNGVSIQKLDGVSGKGNGAYTVSAPETLSLLAVYTDGTILALESTVPATNPQRDTTMQVIGIDPATGGKKFNEPLEKGTGPMFGTTFQNWVIGGDGTDMWHTRMTSRWRWTRAWTAAW